MSILKLKIRACHQAKLNSVTKSPLSSEKIAPKSPKKQISQTKAKSEPKRRQRLKGDCFTPKIYLQTKNIVTNFGKAIATFALSGLALPYVQPILEKTELEESIEVEDVVNFVQSQKSNINSIAGFRALLLIQETDSKKIVSCKKCFQMVAETFIKYFSVNWIVHGRVTYKLEHLKFRYKMLRRIQNPEQFTYLKGYNEKPKKNKTKLN